MLKRGDFTYEGFLIKYHQFIVNGYLLPKGKNYELNTYMKVTGMKIGQFLRYKKKLPLLINPNDHHQSDCEPLFRIAPIVLKYYEQPRICLKYIDGFLEDDGTCYDIEDDQYKN